MSREVKSKVWSHFECDGINKERKTVSCKYCLKILKCSSRSTGLRKHLLCCSTTPYYVKNEFERPANKLIAASTDMFSIDDSNGESLTSNPLNIETTVLEIESCPTRDEDIDAGIPMPMVDSKYWQQTVSKSTSNLSGTSENLATENRVNSKMNLPSSKKRLQLNDAKTLEFVNLYKQEEPLWNITIPEYAFTAVRNQALKRMAEKLNVPNFGPDEVRIKIKTLRNTYCQELRKMAKRKRQSGRKVSNLVWFELMDSFLKPHLKRRFYVTESTPAKRQNKNTVNEEPLVYDNVETAQTGEDPLETERNIIVQPSTSTVGKSIKKARPGPNTRAATKTHATTPENDIVNSLKNISDRLRQIKPEIELYDEFGLHIGSLLRRMPSKKALLLQPQVINIITNAINQQFTSGTSE